MRAIAILFFGSGTCLLTSCTTPTSLNPDIVRKTNASIEKHEAKASKGDKESPERLLRIWGDRPEYVKLLRSGNKVGKGPRLVSAVAPGYPLAASIAKIEAKVAVAIVINEKGEVEAARIIESSDQRFDASAIRAAKRYKFMPALRVDGSPAKFFSYLPFRFVPGGVSSGE